MSDRRSVTEEADIIIDAVRRLKKKLDELGDINSKDVDVALEDARKQAAANAMEERERRVDGEKRELRDEKISSGGPKMAPDEGGVEIQAKVGRVLPSFLPICCCLSESPCNSCGQVDDDDLTDLFGDGLAMYDDKIDAVVLDAGMIKSGMSVVTTRNGAGTLVVGIVGGASAAQVGQ
ncbi:MAG: hypothetical protein RBT11_19615 [Desulfobacterales bacterium]|jgi:hypothetical protein|nr:hypothetical protein [Desulfobacterales bacterium]